MRRKTLSTHLRSFLRGMTPGFRKRRWEIPRGTLPSWWGAGKVDGSNAARVHRPYSETRRRRIDTCDAPPRWAKRPRMEPALFPLARLITACGTRLAGCAPGPARRGTAFFKGILIGIGFGVVASTGLAAEAEPVRKVLDQYAALARSAEQRGTIAVPGKEGWLFFGPELRFLSSGPFWGAAAAKVSKATRPEFADPLPAIVDFHQQLKKLGIELLMVPVPPKSVVYPDLLSDALTLSRDQAPPRIDRESQAFYQLLQKEGIRVLDLTPFFLANRFHSEGALYCRQDTHWSGNGAVLAARKIREEIAGRPWLKALPKRTYQSAWKSFTIAGDLWNAMGEKNLPQEALPVRQVGTGGAGALKPVAPDPKSPVILVGDSHNLVFHAGEDMHTRDAGLPDQLAFELGFPVDLAGVRGSGATPARVNLLRRAQRDPDYWKRKKLVVWCFASREFTQSDGWKKVPLLP